MLQIKSVIGVIWVAIDRSNVQVAPYILNLLRVTAAPSHVCV